MDGFPASVGSPGGACCVNAPLLLSSESAAWLFLHRVGADWSGRFPGCCGTDGDDNVETWAGRRSAVILQHLLTVLNEINSK